MNNKLILESLASDLRRVCLGLQRNSLAMAERFGQEALRRRNQLDASSLDEYVNRLLAQLDKAIKDPEDALMYSTLLQNYAHILSPSRPLQSAGNRTKLASVKNHSHRASANSRDCH